MGSIRSYKIADWNRRIKNLLQEWTLLWRFEIIAWYLFKIKGETSWAPSLRTYW